jgi:PTH1 family peptidyl-tRNA hydrolase
MAIRLIVGLGNPGREHSRDRHNVGFWFVDRLAERERAMLRLEPRYHGLVASVPTRHGDLWLLEPQTYMNGSGRAVGALARFYKLAPEELLVVHDELDFPPGVARLKLGGGVAGHNGLRDIHAHLGTQGFWRLRFGIGHPGDRTRVAGYVLSSPPADEREAIEAQVERGLDVVPLLLTGQFPRAMQQLHPMEKKSAAAADASRGSATGETPGSENK